MTNAIVIERDKTCTKMILKDLQEKQAVVGGLIMPIDLSFGTLWVNEEGTSADGFNSIATDLCGLGGRTDYLLRGVVGDCYLTDFNDAGLKALNRIQREA